MAVSMICKFYLDMRYIPTQGVDAPWNKNRPTIFETSPREPTMTIRRGCEISEAYDEHENPTPSDPSYLV
jgi:hypothetical protein